MSMKILHLEGWKLQDIIKELDTIKRQGFTHIQTSPLQGTKENNYEFWVYYQPVNFEIGNQLGSKEDLKMLCTEAKKRGLKIVVDVVDDHVASSNHNNKQFHEKVVIPQRLQRDSKEVYDYNDRWAITHLSAGLPHLDLNNSELHYLICKYLEELIECGVSGVRQDQTKHHPTLAEDDTFYRNTYLKYADRLTLLGEVIFSNPGLIDEYAKFLIVITENKYCSNYNVCIFGESHDSYHSFGTNKWSDSRCIDEYREAMRQGKRATIFYARPFNNTWQSDEIREINKLK